MRPTAKDFGNRQCTVCGFIFSDEHHIYAELLGKTHCEIMILCPNHQTLAHILQFLLYNRKSIQYIFEYADRSFDSAFVDKVMPSLVRDYDNIAKVFQELLPCSKKEYINELDRIMEKESRTLTENIKILELNIEKLFSLEQVEVSAQQKENALKEIIDFYKNYNSRQAETLRLLDSGEEPLDNYLPYMESAINNYQRKPSKVSDLISKRIFVQERAIAEKRLKEIYPNFCQFVGWRENGYSEILWYKLTNIVMELYIKDSNLQSLQARNDRSIATILFTLAEKITPFFPQLVQ
jgi:hypothetical protein